MGGMLAGEVCNVGNAESLVGGEEPGCDEGRSTVNAGHRDGM